MKIIFKNLFISLVLIHIFQNLFISFVVASKKLALVNGGNWINVADIWENREDRLEGEFTKNFRALLPWMNACYHVLADPSWSSDSTRVNCSLFLCSHVTGTLLHAVQDLPASLCQSLTKSHCPEVTLPCSKQPNLFVSRSQTNPLHILPYIFFKIYFNIISHPNLGLPCCLFPLGLPTATQCAFLCPTIVPS